MTRTTAVEILAVPGIPLVRKDDDLVALIGEGVARGGIVPRGDDVFVLTQKIVSKAEGRMVDLATVEPSAEATELAGNVQKDPRLVELILSESARVVRARPGILTSPTWPRPMTPSEHCYCRSIPTAARRY